MRLLPAHRRAVARRTVCGACIALWLAAGAGAAAEPPVMAAVGRLGLPKTGACTGALVAPDLVLTAAHCVMKSLANEGNASDLEFRTGAYPGHAAHVESVREVTVHPFFIAGEGLGAERLRYDVALARLDEPVPAEAARPLEVVDLPVDGAVPFIASYRGGRPARARERRCPILSETQNVMTLSCEVRGGESGSPVLVASGDSVALLGVVAATARIKRTEVALAGLAAPNLGVLRAMLVPE